MTFTSPSFYLFLPLAYGVFYCTADRYRWLVLLAASYGFYAALGAPQLPCVLALVTVLSFYGGTSIAAASDERRRRRALWRGIAGCVLILAVMKYMQPVLTWLHGGPAMPGQATSPVAMVWLSIGVSYFTFQAISYLVDVYLGTLEPEKHLGRYALGLAFFPKLLQGPIEREGDLLPQLCKPYAFDYDAMRSGMLLFAWGLCKKVVLADRFAFFANAVFDDVHAHTGFALLIGTYAYAFQIYFDFSGYTDMARGTARMFGIGLTENFRSPYLATSIADFWRRWHISFSHWILDYVFRPLQMAWRDHGRVGTALALIVTFLVSGLWHGVGLGFVVWGLLHGLYLAIATYWRPYDNGALKRLAKSKNRWLGAWRVFATFHLVCLAWVFFRARSLSDAWYVVSHALDVRASLARALGMGGRAFLRDDILLGCGTQLALVLAVYLVGVAVVYRKRDVVIAQRPAWFRWAVYYALILSVAFLGFPDGKFVYFQF